MNHSERWLRFFADRKLGSLLSAFVFLSGWRTQREWSAPPVSYVLCVPLSLRAPLSLMPLGLSLSCWSPFQFFVFFWWFYGFST